MRPDQHITFNEGQLWCRRPRKPCLLRLKPQPQAAATEDQPSSATRDPAQNPAWDPISYTARGLAADSAEIGAMCHISTSAHLAINHFLRVDGVGGEGEDLAPRLAEILELDCEVARRVASAVSAACRDLNCVGDDT